MTGAVFTLVAGLGLAYTCWYVSRDSVRRRGGPDFARGRPGLRTGATLADEDAWITAHERIAGHLRLVAYWFSVVALVGPLGFVFDWPSSTTEAVFVVGVLAGVLTLGVIAAVGDRAARSRTQPR